MMTPPQPHTHQRLVIISPPEIGSEQWLISPNHRQVLGQFFYWAEVFSVDITVGRSYGWHVGSIEHHRYYVVREDVEELLSHIVLQTQN